jgi:hypothetical protein
MFLSGAFLAVWATGALAKVPFEGGTWSFSRVIRSKSCDFSPRLAAEGRAGCFTDMLPWKQKATLDMRPGKLPVVRPLWPCALERDQPARLVRYVAPRTRPRRFVLTIDDRAALREAFVVSCSPQYPLTRYRLKRWSSIVIVSADGQRVRQRDVLWESFDTGDVRQRLRLTASVRGRRTGDVATIAAVGEDTGGIAE